MNKKALIHDFPHPRHDHHHCIAAALQEAERSCRQRSLRLTHLRRRVLELIWQEHRPIKAYELMEQLRRDGLNATPPTAYRALDFLLNAGLIHRLETLNAFIGCSWPGARHGSQFLICQKCHVVAELDAPQMTEIIDRQSQQLGFQAGQHIIEIRGLCAHCKKA
jgi:Fur family zinc uptake transcriptional regulator